MGNWSKLPRDLLSAIARRLDRAADSARFSGVCRNWLSLAKSEITNLPRNPPWLMLTAKPDSDHRNFIGTDGKPFSLELPNSRGSRCIGSTGCWVVMIDEACDTYIINPFSSEKIDLPSLRSLDDFTVDDPEEEDILDLRDFYVEKVILSFPDSQSPREEDFIAVAIYALSNKLAYTRKGAKSWQPIVSVHSFQDVIFYQEKLYAVNDAGIVFEFKVHCSLDDQKPNAAPISNSLLENECPDRHLVVFRGLLLQVVNLTNTIGFNIFKLDFTSGGWVELNNLGRHSLFIGYNTGVSLLATSNYTFKPNCIYFSTEEFLKIQDDGKIVYKGSMGIFYLADYVILPYYQGPYSGTDFTRPVWIVPNSLSQNQ